MAENEEIKTETKFLRKIVSFVRREGRLTNGQANAIDEMWPTMGIDFNSNNSLNFNSVFGNDNPVVIEIGFGMGKSLVQMAKEDPNTNYIGIEVHKPGIGACLMAARDAGISNIRVFEHDAVEVLESMISDGSISRVQIYFPDPWQKKKHNKRRIIQPKFFELLAKKIMSGGIVHLATDWAEYAEHMRDVGNGNTDFENMSESGDFIPRPDYRPLTKFEERGIGKGHGIWDLMFKRK